MATKKLTAMTESTLLAGTDLFYAVRDVGGTPVSRRVEWESVLAYLAPPGQLIGGYISPTVASNNLTLAIKTNAGNNPSASEPVFVNIAGTVRAITAATSTTKNAGTNWGAAGSNSTANVSTDWFAYVVWDASPGIVAISASRYPGGRIVSDFSATTTNAKHLFDYGDFATADNVEVCGRFAATLSGGAGYTWSVPTYTNILLVKEPTRVSRWLAFTPTWTNLTLGSATQVGYFRLSDNTIDGSVSAILSSTTVGASPYLTPPFPILATGATYEIVGTAIYRDTGTALHHGSLAMVSGNLYPQVYKADVTYATSIDLTGNIPMTWANTDELFVTFSGRT